LLPKHRRSDSGYDVIFLDCGGKDKLGEAVFFVNSFMAIPTTPVHRIADCNYGDMSVSATIMRDNIYRCQFHPEKSGEAVLKILKIFLI